MDEDEEIPYYNFKSAINIAQQIIETSLNNWKTVTKSTTNVNNLWKRPSFKPERKVKSQIFSKKDEKGSSDGVDLPI